MSNGKEVSDEEVEKAKTAVVTFNPAQLATWPQAIKLAAEIQAYRVQTGAWLGGGILPLTKDGNTSGIYLPSWISGPGGDPEPSDPTTNSYWLQYRFANGVSGINVGLILDKIKRFNGNTEYVFGTLNADLQV